MNRLADETSPYLRQHAGNPVDWFPWGDEAFGVARREDRPVFLSIGYSACHWCHVMAHESFEDPATAAVLNGSFVCIKVDREERPDVDQVYMEAVQAITGSGGWPMSVFLTPDGRPFYGGTYFPPDQRGGMPSFRTVLTALTEAWDHRRDEVDHQADELSQAVAARAAGPARPRTTSLFDPSRPADDDLLSAAAGELAARFDPQWGGFGRAPKFPQPTLVDLALRHALRHPDGRDGDGSEAMARSTLDAMAAGGIHDHLGGGFARYSTDDRWLVPHFEKMLYDQAGLLRAYLHGWQVTRREDYLAVMDGIVGYVRRDLTSPEGGVYSAEDADSEGVEGRFYVWSPAQVALALAGTEGGAEPAVDAVTAFFDVTEGGNWEGRSILRRPPGESLRGDPVIEAGRDRLFRARSERTRPGLDDKVLTEWNAMFASALAEAAAATGNPAWRDTAAGIGDFLVDHLRRPDGRWLRSWQRRGGGRHLAYAGDYAWLVDAFTRLGELTGQARWTRARRGHRRRHGRPLRRRGRRWVLHHRTRCRAAHRAHQGGLRRRHSLLQRRRRAGLRPPGRHHRGAAVHRPGPRRGRHVRPAPRPAPHRLRPYVAHRRHPPRRDHRGGGGRRPARPRRRGPASLAPRRRAGVGRAHRLPALAGPGARPRLRLPPVRLPGPGRRPGHPVGPVGRGRGGMGRSGVSRHSTRTPRSGTARNLARSIQPRTRIEVTGGSQLTLLVLACHREDTIGVDLASGTLVRVRVSWPEDHAPDLSPFDVVQTQLADEPERDDLAQPEAVTSEGLPRHLGTLHGRRVRRLLHRLAAPVEEHVLGFPGASAPYWEFRGFRPSLALIVPTKGPVLFRRLTDRTVWVRFGWGRSDNWLPVEDPRAERALDVARRDRLAGKDLATALGSKPHYVVAAITTPRDGHCYKTVRGLLPRS